MSRILREIPLTVIVMVGILFAQTENSRHLSLQEALQFGQQQNYQLMIASAKQQMANGDNVSAWQGILPHVSLHTQYIKTDDPVNVFGLKLRQGVFSQTDFSIPLLNSPEEFDSYTTSLQIQFPIISPEAIIGKAAAAQMAKAAKAGRKRVEQTVALQIKKAYYGLILAYESQKAIEQAVKSAETHRDNARIAFEQGLINQADYFASEVRLAELQEQLLIAANNIKNASDMLRLSMGLREDTQLIPTDSLRVNQFTLAEKTALYIDNRPDLKAISHQLSAAKLKAWSQGTSWLPSISAFATKEWASRELFKNTTDHYTVGVQLSWKLFDGLGRIGQFKSAKAQSKLMDATYKMVKHQAENEISAAYRNVSVARQRIAVAKRAVEQAQISLQITEKRFAEGLVKTADLLDSEVMFTNAHLRWLKANYDYLVAFCEWEYATSID
jgi:outer membrane protein TolC